MIKITIVDIENTHTNTSICSCFKILEAKGTMFHPNLIIPYPYVESNDIYSDTNYDINPPKTYILRGPKSSHVPIPHNVDYLKNNS